MNFISEEEYDRCFVGMDIATEPDYLSAVIVYDATVLGANWRQVKVLSREAWYNIYGDLDNSPSLRQPSAGVDRKQNAE